MTTSPICMSFGTLIPNVINNFEFEKMTARAILNSQITMANQKIEIWVFKQKWVIYAANDERIPNAVSNLNRTTFHPIFGQKVAKNGRKLDIASFRLFSGQEGDKMLSDLDFETRFRILSSHAAFITLFC